MQNESILSPLLPFVYIAVGGLLALEFAKQGRRRWQQAPLPSGPPGWPVIGNILDWPDIQKQADVFSGWAKQYGPLVYVNVFGQSFVIINSSDVANDLLTKRSKNYSDRPVTTMLRELTGYADWLLPFMPYDERWRAYRKLFHTSYRVQEVEALRPLILQTCDEFIQCLTSSPEHVQTHIRAYIGKVLSKVTYGHEQPITSPDPLLELFVENMDEFNEELFGNVFMADLLPFLRHIPSTWPGAGFKRLAIRQRTRAAGVVEGLYERLKSGLRKGIVDSCVVTRSIESAQQATGEISPAQEELIKNSAAASFIAGTDTTTSLMANFLLAMSLHPEHQQRAQDELDTVTGGTRQPSFDDKSLLPFLEALLLECLRWNAPVPPGVPHRAVQEDVYNGMRIPAGCIMIGNIGHMLHDPRYFENPQDFNPARFLDAEGKKRANLELLVMDVFGFGRRICPGRHLALDSAWIAFARTLSSFIIRKALDEDGKEVEPLLKFTAGLTSHPVPYKCRVVPRVGTLD